MGTIQSHHGGILESQMKRMRTKRQLTENGWMLAERVWQASAPEESANRVKDDAADDRGVTATEEEYQEVLMHQNLYCSSTAGRFCSEKLNNARINVRGSWELIPPYTSALIIQGIPFITTQISKHEFFVFQRKLLLCSSRIEWISGSKEIIILLGVNRA